MARVYFTNQAVANGADAYYLIKTLMQANGWVHQASGNGTTFSTTPGNGNDQITTSALMQTARAWIVIKPPTGTHQWLIQREANSARLRLKFSPSAGFTGLGLDASGVANGAISATVCPSALDQVIVQGGLSDQANNGAFGDTFPATTSFVLHGFLDNAAPYAFCFWVVSQGLPMPQWVWYLDPVTQAWPGDPDPYVIHSSLQATNGTSIFNVATAGGLSDEASGPVSLFQRTGNTPNAARCPGCAWGHTTDAAIFPRSTSGANQASGTGERFGGFALSPMIYARRTTLSGPNGWKGVSTLFQIRQGTLANMTTLTAQLARDRVAIGDVITFWDGSVPQIG